MDEERSFSHDTRRAFSAACSVRCAALLLGAYDGRACMIVRVGRSDLPNARSACMHAYDVPQSGTRNGSRNLKVCYVIV